MTNLIKTNYYLTLTEENLFKYASSLTRQELANKFQCSLSLINKALKLWNLKAKRGSVGRPAKLLINLK